MKPKSNLTPDLIRSSVAHCIETSLYKDRIKSLYLFGSYTQGTAASNSDIDLLMIPKHPFGYFTLVRIQDELSRALQHEVDLVTHDALSRHIRGEILKQAIVIYEN